jgi:hypothetical protein
MRRACNRSTLHRIELGLAAEEDNLFSTQILRQKPVIESNSVLVVGKFCLAPAMNQRTLVEEITGEFDLSNDYFSWNLNSTGMNVASFSNINPDQFNYEPAVDRIYVHQYRSLDFKNHVNINDLRVKEFTFNHGGNLFYVKMENQITRSLNPFQYAVLIFSQTPKQNLELHLNRGRHFSAKSGVFGLNRLIIINEIR